MRASPRTPEPAAATNAGPGAPRPLLDPSRPLRLSPRLLRRWPLPALSGEETKEPRGVVLVVGGSPGMPGGVILAATAALRAGAGKLKIATGESIAAHVAAAIPEGRVIALPELPDGALDPRAADDLAETARLVNGLLIGPSMVNEEAARRLLRALVPRLAGLDLSLILDATALAAVYDDHALLHPLAGRVALTPHAGEMAQIMGLALEEVQAAPEEIARRAAADLGAVVALKGAETLVAAPDGALYRNCRGNVGLAISGSGDTLSGIVAGLAARGADPLRATAWAVFVHACAGDLLARRVGQVGFLPRELLAEIPRLLDGLDGWRGR